MVLGVLRARLGDLDRVLLELARDTVALVFVVLGVRLVVVVCVLVDLASYFSGGM
jgi:hypothetical protein